MKLMSRLAIVFDRTLDTLVFIACAILAFVALSIGAEVFMRYFLDSPIIWVVEISELSLLYITFLGTAWLLRREGHVSMDFVVNRLGPKNRGLLGAVTSVFGAIVCLIIVWYGTRITWYNLQTGAYLETLLEPSKGAILAIIPFGSFLLFIQFLRRTHGYFRSWRLASNKDKNILTR